MQAIYDPKMFLQILLHNKWLKEKSSILSQNYLSSSSRRYLQARAYQFHLLTQIAWEGKIKGEINQNNRPVICCWSANPVISWSRESILPSMIFFPSQQSALHLRQPSTQVNPGVLYSSLLCLQIAELLVVGLALEGP